MRHLVLLGFGLLPLAAALPQDRMYVTDVVELGMHAAADTSDEAFRTLLSGTEVTVLERATDFARVRTAEGEEGWVRASQLTADPPSRLRVTELEEAVIGLEAAVGELERENQAYLDRFERYRGTLPWLWVVGALVVVFGAGVFAGYWWLDRAIRRRYGGFKVY